VEGMKKTFWCFFGSQCRMKIGAKDRRKTSKHEGCKRSLKSPWSLVELWWSAVVKMCLSLAEKIKRADGL